MDKEQEEKYKYLADTFDTLILRDIRQKYKIRNISLMDKIAEFMMDNISNLTSSRKIADTLTKNTDNINHKTVGAYLDYGRVLENIVALELMRRGYEIYAGVLYKKEIDFVAVKQI